MAIVIDTPIVHKSIATVLKAIDGQAYIYDNPNQQATKLPAWFIIHREPVKIEREISRAWLVYSLDLFYMLEYNTTRLFDDYARIADDLNTSLIYLPIYGKDIKVQVYEREWGLQPDALRYSITLRFRVRQDTVLDEKMQVIESLDVFLKNQRESIVTFTNTEHPEFDPDFPTSLSVTTGKTINLPFVDGKFEDELYLWAPSGWSIGSFGELIRVNENLSAELLWSSSQKTATISFNNNEHPEFAVELPADITANKGTEVTLPTVEATIPVGPVDWNTTSWDIGNFGAPYILNEDAVATLQWTNQDVFFDVSFANTKPEFEVDMPSSMHVARGNHIILPTVEGTYYQDGYRWNPEAWSIGQFGEELTVESDLNANLIWRKVELLTAGGVLTETSSTSVVIESIDSINIGSIKFGNIDLRETDIPQTGEFSVGTMKFREGILSDNTIPQTGVVVEDV